jgi:hypothetical protein
MGRHLNTAWLVVRQGYNVWSCVSAAVALAVIVFAGFLGPQGSDTGLSKALQWLTTYRWPIFFVLLLSSVYMAAHTAIGRIEQHFYATHPQARVDRVKAALSDLLYRGEGLAPDDHEGQISWDREVCRVLNFYVGDNGLKYQEATRALQPHSERPPLDLALFGTALKILRSYSRQVQAHSITWRGEQPVP